MSDKTETLNIRIRPQDVETIEAIRSFLENGWVYSKTGDKVTKTSAVIFALNQTLRDIEAGKYSPKMDKTR